MPAPVLPTAVDRRDEAFQANRDAMLGLLTEIDGLLQQASLGGGSRAIERHRGRGKLLIRERIALLLDPDTPFLELSPLAGYQTNYTVGGGMVLGIGVVEGTECVIIGNDPTDLGELLQHCVPVGTEGLVAWVDSGGQNGCGHRLSR